MRILDSGRSEELCSVVESCLDHAGQKRVRPAESLPNLENDSETASKRSKTEASSSKQSDGKGGIDWDTAQSRPIALHIAYDGENLSGYTTVNVYDPDETSSVESLLLRALVSRGIVRDRQWAQFSRSGRTDKGVSALGQVIGLQARSRARLGEELPEPDREMDYVSMLNSTLPLYIRVLGWAPVPEEFSARFSAGYRVYRYYFPRRSLDIDAMRRAAKLLEGEHDVRNFGKLMPEQQGVPHRIVLSARIIQAAGAEGETFWSPEGDGYDDPGWFCPTHIRTKEEEEEEEGTKDKELEAHSQKDKELEAHSQKGPETDGLEFGSTGRDVYFMEIAGAAFLWHQVRSIAAVLFLVGQGKEEVETVRELLDTRPGTVFGLDKGRPRYECAMPEPLVLWHCHFDGLSGMRWHLSSRAAERLWRSLEQSWWSRLCKAHFWAAALRRVGLEPVRPADGPVGTTESSRPALEMPDTELGIRERRRQRAEAIIASSDLREDEKPSILDWFVRGGDVAARTRHMAVDSTVALDDAIASTRDLPPSDAPLPGTVSALNLILQQSKDSIHLPIERQTWAAAIDSNHLPNGHPGSDAEYQISTRKPYVRLRDRGRDGTMAVVLRASMRKSPHGAGVSRTRADHDDE